MLAGLNLGSHFRGNDFGCVSRYLFPFPVSLQFLLSAFCFLLSASCPLPPPSPRILPTALQIEWAE